MSIRFGILTVSDRSSRGERPDVSGPALENEVKRMGWEVTHTQIVPDDVDSLSASLMAWCDQGNIDVLLTTGGTGFAPRDITPEVTLSVIQRLTPGLPEAMRAASLKNNPHAMLSRAVAGIRGSVLIVNLPGSPKAAVENFQVIAPVLMHAVQLLQGDPIADRGHIIKA
jgi:molybdenum cofactor synthesis domain-containing protein